MRHYHGTPIGGTRASADEFADGRLLLVPWKRSEDLMRAMTLSRGFIVDNSAFSFWKTGEQPNWKDYMDWCGAFARHPRFDFALIPDVIDGSEEENDRLLGTWVKYRQNKIKGCPVWHLHESLERLAVLCEQWDHVALGSSGQWPTPGVGSWWERMDDAFDVICDKQGYPTARIHGLRMLRSDIVTRYPFSSGDSTTASRKGVNEAQKNGVDKGWGSATIARRLERAQSPSRWVRGSIHPEFNLIG